MIQLLQKYEQSCNKSYCIEFIIGLILWSTITVAAAVPPTAEAAASPVVPSSVASAPASATSSVVESSSSAAAATPSVMLFYIWHMFQLLPLLRLLL